MNNFALTTYTIGQVKTNCYFVSNKQTGETLIFDPGDEAAFLAEECKEENLKPVAILLTHGHFDHTMAAAELRDMFKIPVYAMQAEKEILCTPGINCAEMYGLDVAVAADIWLDGRETLHLAGIDVQVIATPGHSVGSCCFYFKDLDILISGDTLFRETYGRTDLPTNSFTAILDSIVKKLFILPDKTNVYPGHGESTTIAHEKRYNPILRELR